MEGIYLFVTILFLCRGIYSFIKKDKLDIIIYSICTVAMVALLIKELFKVV